MTVTLGCTLGGVRPHYWLSLVKIARIQCAVVSLGVVEFSGSNLLGWQLTSEAGACPCGASSCWLGRMAMLGGSAW